MPAFATGVACLFCDDYEYELFFTPIFDAVVDLDCNVSGNDTASWK